MTRLVVLISGTGSNLQALIDAVADGQLDARIVAVISNRRKAFGLERAHLAGVDTLVLATKPFKKLHGDTWREAYDAELAQRVAQLEPDLVVLAGWMHILTPGFLNRFPRRVINLHPALPGQFDGTRAIERAFEAFGRGEISHTGVMVHWVIPEVDAGEPIITEEVPIEAADTLDDLAARIHRTEHRLIVEAVRRAAGRRA